MSPTPIAAIILLASVAFAADPILSVRMDRTPTEVLAPRRVTSAPNHQRIPLRISIDAGNSAARFEKPEIRAINQHPDYFKVRPPANLTISVQRVIATGRESVPIRIYSSGSGQDLSVFFVQVDLDFLEPKDLRLKRAAQFVEWMAANGQDSSRVQPLAGNNDLVNYFEDQYINNPPGDYELVVRYTPTTPENWRGSLITPPLPIRITNAGDFFDTLKANLTKR